jgi:methionyl-tRNA formyltransferase
MRILFFGTPGFAVPSLRALRGAGHEVVAVVTQPDRSHGRSRSRVVAPAVKLEAERSGLVLLQPDKPVGVQLIDQLSALGADLGVVVAYGHILRPQVLAIPRRGMVNVHASLLPRWRGAAPIQWAIRSGDRTTGITIMQMEAGLDSGPVWLARSTPIGLHETAGALTDRLSLLGAEALLEALPLLSSGARPVAQDESAVTFAPKIDRTTAHIDWSDSAAQLAQHVAAFDPVPGAWTTLGGVDVKVFGAEGASGAAGIGAHETHAAPTASALQTPGMVRRADDVLEVTTGSGILLLREVQPAGKKRQPVAEWVRGRGVAAGARFR